MESGIQYAETRVVGSLLKYIVNKNGGRVETKTWGKTTIEPPILTVQKVSRQG